MLEEEARQTKMAASGGMSVEERDKINKIVEEGADVDSVTLDETGRVVTESFECDGTVVLKLHNKGRQ